MSMAKAPVGQRCVHCLVADATTWDHGVPQSWYPTDSAPNVRHVKAPSCLPCNQRVRLIEEELLLPLALSMSPDDVRAKGIPDKVMRSMDPDATDDPREKCIRSAKRAAVKARIKHYGSDDGAFPGAERHPGNTGAGIAFRAQAVQEFGEKLTRVVFWAEYNKTYIETDHAIETHVNWRADTEEIVQSILRGRMIDVPPGIRVGVRLAEDRPPAGMAVVDLWGWFRLVASVLHVDAVQPIEPDDPADR
jgi:hypothetical protein